MALDDSSDGESSTNTRRRFLRVASGVGVAGLLGAGGWIGRTQYLSAERDRTDLVTASPNRSLVSGPSSHRVPAGDLLAELEQFSTNRSATGLQAAVHFNDRTRWVGVAGNADHGEDDPLTLDFHLYVGSVTKLFTATLAMRQVERGAIGLSDSIEQWFDLPYADEVTVRMLLNHTSGVPNYTADPWFIARYFGRPTKQWSPTKLVAVVDEADPRFEPGSRHEYSNTNYVLLGLLLERLTETSYRQLLGDLVRDELGYDRTYYLGYPDHTPIANGYDESIFNLGRRNLTGFRTSLETGAYAAGGILSTAPNTAGFVQSLFTGQILNDETLGEMRTFVAAPDEDVTDQRGYGLGIRHLRIDGEDLFGHTGTIPGYSAVAVYHDQLQYTIAVLSNVSTIDQSGICESLQQVVKNQFYNSTR